ncbi:MAG: class I SAM-dependent methyltransferase [Rhodocyclaceae bacterium]|nr:class I SAM-dependent methyltransferase [Rhodocyclaceae bacterium]
MCACRLCDNAIVRTWKSQDAKSDEVLEFGLCGSCGLVQQTSLPSDEELRIYYSHNYREDYKSTHQPKLKYVHRAGRTAKDRLSFIRLAGVTAEGKRLLDIGAGGGEFCYMATKAGFSAHGIEPHQGYSEFARTNYGIDIQSCGIADLNEQQADVITMFHVLEHLAHPRAAMKKLWEALSDEGHLIIEVPNIHQADASPHNIYFKAHLFYYSRFSLMTLASQYFELVCMQDEGNLFMAFRKRAVPLSQLVLPTQSQIEFTLARLEKKGWIEYLTTGRGLLKPFRRVDQILLEPKSEHTNPKLVLDAVWANDKPLQHITASVIGGTVLLCVALC